MDRGVLDRDAHFERAVSLKSAYVLVLEDFTVVFSALLQDVVLCAALYIRGCTTSL